MAVRGVLLDIEGVLLDEGKPVAGAAAAVAALRARDLGVRFLTNTTTAPCAAVAARLASAGIEAAEEAVLTPAATAARALAERGVTRIHLAAPPALAADFQAFALVEEAPGAVVLGDLHEGFTFARLDALFAMVRDGAPLIALHRNRFTRRSGRISLDLGPFVAALEYAAQVEAEVVGKPSPAFFRAAVDGLGLSPDAALMVGDDIEADVGGALSAGLAAVQVRTGKYTARDEAPARPVPTGRIASVAALPDWLDSAG